jgi:hypothetical protein
MDIEDVREFALSGGPVQAKHEHEHNCRFLQATKKIYFLGRQVLGHDEGS